MIVKPTFFILGAPKSGTTSLARYLSEHPDIYFSKPKETNYFDTDLHPVKYKTDEEYLNAHFSITESVKAVGEGSVWNLYSRVAVKNILNLSPKAKFIVILRNPAKQFNSFYHHRRANGRESHPDIEEAWQVQAGRSYEEIENPRRILCGDLYKQGEQLERLYNLVPKERVLVLWFDDFYANTHLAYRATLSFLGLDDDGRTNFSVVNPNRATSNELVRRMIIAYRKYKKRLRIPLHLGNSWFARNIVYGKKPPLEPTLRDEILQWCLEDTKLLERLTNRSLASWYPHRQ